MPENTQIKVIPKISTDHPHQEPHELDPGFTKSPRLEGGALGMFTCVLLWFNKQRNISWRVRYEDRHVAWMMAQVSLGKVVLNVQAHPVPELSSLETFWCWSRQALPTTILAWLGTFSNVC